MNNNNNKEKSMLKKFIIIGFIVVLTVLSLFLISGMNSKHNNDSKNDVDLYEVKRGDLVIDVTENGDIKALSSVDIKSGVEGRTTITYIVDEGTIVTAEDVNNGKVLIKLDSAEIEERLTQQEVSFLSSEASYKEAQESLEIQIKQNESDIKEAEMAFRFALMDLQKYLGEKMADYVLKKYKDQRYDPAEISSLINNNDLLGGEAKQTLREKENDIKIADKEYTSAEDKLAGTQKLYDHNYVAEFELRRDELDKESRAIQVEKAKTALKLFKLYDFPRNAEARLGEYEEEKWEFERTKARARSRRAQAEAKLKSTEATYLLQKSRVEKLRQQLASCTIKAPAPGQVVYSTGDRRWDRKTIEVGAEIYRGQEIISIPDPTKMKVEVKIPETWIDKIEPGQEADIKITAFPEMTFEGKVIKKRPLADQDNWWNPDLKVYTTDVSIEGNHDFLKTGMTAKVTIVIKVLEDIINVPIQSVINNEGEKICFVKNGLSIEQLNVETGEFNNSFVEIRKGLSEGDRILLNPPKIVETQDK